MDFLDIHQAAKYLNVPEHTLLRWVRQGIVPHKKHGATTLFPVRDIREWAIAKGLHKLQRDEPKAAPNNPVESALVDALQLGGVHQMGPSSVLEEIFNQALGAIFGEKVPPGLVEALLARENLCSTGIGHGIALPHPQNPEFLKLNQNIVGGFLLTEPLEMGAIDGHRVFCLFLILARDMRNHLTLMSQIAAQVKNSDTRKAIRVAWEQSSPQTLHDLFVGAL